MMLHEHRMELSLQSKNRDGDRKDNFSHIDEQQLDEFERLLDESLRLGTRIAFKIKTPGNKGADSRIVRGVVIKKDVRKGEIMLFTGEGMEKITVCHLLDIKK
jgi:hypothetical protein